MLVLSRKANQRILFPGLGISIEVARIRGKVVSLGIDAPENIQVIREELADQQAADQIGVTNTPITSRERHEFRNRLNTVMLGLTLIQRKLELGHAADIEKALLRVFRELESVDAELTGVDGDNKSVDDVLPARRALLVDDNRNESELLADYLRTFDYEIDTAYDGLEAVEYLEAHEKPDIVLLDMQMPRLNGKETIRRIRQNPALDGIRVFAISGLTSEQAGIEIGPGGVDRWFTKPIRPSELIEEIRSELALLGDS